MPTRNHVLLCSSGRSGSNWLLDILDLSERTFPRNEPYGLVGRTAFARLIPARETVAADDALLQARWDDVVATAAASMIDRDHIVTAHKRYIHPWAKRLKLDLLMRKARLRRAAACLLPAIRGIEWPLPWWLVDHQALADALPIFKINNAPGWAVWALRHRLQAQVLHLIRHPGGMLNSWSKRYRPTQDTTEHLHVNRARLHRVAEAEPTWAARFGDIDALSLDESELWYWRYANEVLYVEGLRHERYAVIPFERLTSEPRTQARHAFELCGLEWNRRIETQVEAMSRQSQQIARAWQQNLTDEQIAAVERVLEGSPLATLWQPRNAEKTADAGSLDCIGGH